VDAVSREVVSAQDSIPDSGAITGEQLAQEEQTTAQEQENDVIASQDAEDRALEDLEQFAAANRYSLRPRKIADYKHIDEVMMHISVKQALQQHGPHAKEAIVKELQQMVDQGVFEPVSMDKAMAQRSEIIRSFMFVKEKFDAAGKFDKLKARLVAGGHMQDRTVYEDVSSPTVALTSCLMVAAIAAKERRHVAVVDIAGAYLNAEMKDAEVVMQLDEV
jgi:hypothetical protein